MLGELLSTVGLVVSGQGLIGSIRLENSVKDLNERLSDAEQLLRRVTNDTQFLRTALESLKTFDAKFREANERPVLDVKYLANEESLNRFLANPEFFGGRSQFSLETAIEQALVSRLASRNESKLPVLIARGGSNVQVFILPAERLRREDVLGSEPLDTFDPATVERLAKFLSDLKMTMEAQDQLRVQFEEER